MMKKAEFFVGLGLKNMIKNNISFEEWFNEKSTPSIVNIDYVSSKISKIVNNDIDVYYRDGVDEFSTNYYYGFETTHYYYLLIYYVRDELHGDRNNHIYYTTREQL